MLIVPFRSHALSDHLCDLPISLAVPEFGDCLIEPLDSPLGGRERSVLFKCRSSRQNHIGITAGFRKEDVLNYKKVQLFESASNVAGVRIGRDHVFPGKIHVTKLSVIDSVDHLVVIPAAYSGEGSAPVLLELLPNGGVGNVLVARKVIRHGADVTRTLYVVVSPQR